MPLTMLPSKISAPRKRIARTVTSWTRKRASTRWWAIFEHCRSGTRGATPDGLTQRGVCGSCSRWVNIEPYRSNRLKMYSNCASAVDTDTSTVSSPMGQHLHAWRIHSIILSSSVARTAWVIDAPSLRMEISRFLHFLKEKTFKSYSIQVSENISKMYKDVNLITIKRPFANICMTGTTLLYVHNFW